MCCFEGDELQHQSKVQLLTHPLPNKSQTVCLGIRGVWVLWGVSTPQGKAHHKISSPSKPIPSLNTKGITSLGTALRLPSATGSLKILIWLLNISRVLFLTRSPPKLQGTSPIM